MKLFGFLRLKSKFSLSTVQFEAVLCSKVVTLSARTCLKDYQCQKEINVCSDWSLVFKVRWRYVWWIDLEHVYLLGIQKHVE